jgi:hypothetical protein
MQITRSSGTETTVGPGEWFTGTVFVDTVAPPSEPSRLGQTIYVTEGVGPCQRRGGPQRVVRQRQFHSNLAVLIPICGLPRLVASHPTLFT